MHAQSIDSVLAATPLFRDMAPASRQTITACFRQGSFERGENIITKGGSSRSLIIILSGEAVVIARKEEHAYRMDHACAGDILGEGAFFDPAAQRTADVIAQQPTMVAMMTRERFDSIALSHPAAAAALERAILRVLADRVQTTNHTLKEMLDVARGDSWLRAIRRFIGVRGQR